MYVGKLPKLSETSETNPNIEAESSRQINTTIVTSASKSTIDRYSTTIAANDNIPSIRDQSLLGIQFEYPADGINSESEVTTAEAHNASSIVQYYNVLTPSKSKETFNSTNGMQDADEIPTEQMSIVSTRDWVNMLGLTKCPYKHKETLCLGELKFLKWANEGNFEIVSFKCSSCCRAVLFYNSNPKRIGPPDKENSFRPINVSILASHLFAGGTFRKYMMRSNICDFLRPIAKGTFHRIETFVWDCVAEVGKEDNKKLVSKLQRCTVIVASGDGSWSHRRNAGQGVYTVLDCSTGKIIFRHVMMKSRWIQDEKDWGTSNWTEVFKGNHSSTSHSMEIIGFNAFYKLVKGKWTIRKIEVLCIRQRRQNQRRSKQS